MHAAPVQRKILSTRRIMVPPLTLCAYMKKGPNLRWSLIQCSGGDEGNRTPDLLTASQALSQLSYAPVRRSTIRELPRRCKDNFGKTFAARLSSALRTSRVPPLSLSQRGPPSAQRPSRRRRARYRGRSRSRPHGGFKTMPVYGARPATPEHAVIGKIKTAGRRLAHSVKRRAWTAGPGPAP